MKGVELPINVLVIVAVAVIVLLGIAALFITGFSPFSTVSGQESYKNVACAQLVRGGCVDSPSSITINFDANGDGEVCSADSYYYCNPDNKYINQKDEPTCNQANKCEYEDGTTSELDTLQDLCANFYQAPTTTECKRVCACPGY